MGAGEEESLWTSLVPRKQSMTERAMAEEADIADTLGPALSFWRSNVNFDDFIHRLNLEYNRKCSNVILFGIESLWNAFYIETISGHQ